MKGKIYINVFKFVNTGKVCGGTTKTRTEAASEAKEERKYYLHTVNILTGKIIKL